MVNSCPVEADPRENVERFVNDDSVRVMSGLRTEGVGPMMDVLEAEIRRQRPDSTLIILDRDVISDNGICFPRELADYLTSSMMPDTECDIIIREDLPIVGWQAVMDGFRREGVRAYLASTGCRQVPVCSRIL